MRRLILLLAALLLGATLVAPAQAQQAASASRPARVPVTVAFVPALPAGSGPFQILRRADTAPHDVILLAPGADAAVLSDAVRTLLLARAQGGDRASANAMLRVRREGASAQTRPAFPWASRVIEDLRRAPRKEIAGVGNVQGVEIWLPRRGARRAP